LASAKIFDFKPFSAAANGVVTDYTLFACIDFVVYAFFGAICGTCFRYYVKNRIASIIAMLLVIISNTLGTVFPVTLLPANYLLEEQLFYIYIPLCIFLPLSCISLVTSLILTNRSDIRI
jgi:hypothetical protein